MKILHISSSDLIGGAAIAAYRIHSGLEKQKDIESVMIVRNKLSDNKSVYKINHFLNSSINLSIRVFFLKLGKKLISFISQAPFSIVYLPKSGIKKAIKNIQPQIIHIHWLDETILTFKDLKEINIPIIYSMHDMWVFTGGCHYSNNCKGFESKCGKCPILKSSISNDISRFIFKKKRKYIMDIKFISFLSVSTWLTKSAKKSPITQDLEIQTLPNLIDTSIFKKRDVRKSKNRLGLNNKKKYILFGAINSIDDPRKGWKSLVKALKSLKCKNVELLVFGNESDVSEKISDINVTSFYQVNDINQIIDLYNSSDLMVVPSLQEAFGQTIIEAMSCGTPVVSFDGTGPTDIIVHLENGYLAKKEDFIDLANGIEYFINKSPNNLTSRKCRNHILMNFSIDNNIFKYIEFYKKKYNEFHTA